MEHTRRSRVWLYPLAVLGSISLLWFTLLCSLDFLIFYELGQSFWTVLTTAAADEIQGTLGGLPEVVVAILGIVITVVSIILQLSATRYTPRVTEMFFRDRTNLMVLSYFVVTATQCVWVSLAVRQKFIPPILVISTLVLITAAILVLIPYFIYVFHFLEPERVVKRLQKRALDQALGSHRGTTVEHRRAQMLMGVEQLADVAVNALSQKDRIIASRSIDALRDLATSYLQNKAQLSPQWYAISGALLENPDFVVMSPESVGDLNEQQIWLEWKILRQYQAIYNESVNRVVDICQLVAINTRYIGECAIRANDRHVLRTTIKFFNTYLRSAINQKDVRTAYNVFHQYRQLAESLLAENKHDDVVEVAGYFKYYGQIANGIGLSFVTETAAYDLSALCELANTAPEFEAEEQLLEILLDVDKTPETEAEERSLRGVRKAQIKLATHYLNTDHERLARQIFQDMKDEQPERLSSIREELSLTQDRDFWEVIDRGRNFDYLDPRRRAQLDTYFRWFDLPDPA
jgi:hypothetical protein